MAAIEGKGCIGIGRTVEGGNLVKVEFARPPCGDHDVKVGIQFCGMCHSDIHTVKGELGKLPAGVTALCCPGHEIIGTVMEVGEAVNKFHVGQTVGIGVLVDSCGSCRMCSEGQEQYCPDKTFTYNSPTPKLKTKIGTQGGYSQPIVVRDKFVFSIPENLPQPGVAPLLCAGITTYSPLKLCNVQAGTKVLIAGLGGLGNTACKIAKAMGGNVTVISRDKSKQSKADALGVELISAAEAEGLKSHTDTFDVCIDTIPYPHDLSAYMHLLRAGGHMVMIGCITGSVPLTPMEMILKKLTIHGSMIGGVGETQEMLEFCGKHGIVADHEVISADRITWAVDQIVQGAVDHRFVIDLTTLAHIQT